MRPTTSDPAGLAARLDRLEAQNRRLRLMSAAALLAVASGVLMGWAAPQDEVVWAGQFILLDGNQKKRAELSTDENHAPLLEFFDEAGRVRAEIGTLANGQPISRFRDAGGRTRMQLEVGASGGVWSLWDAAGKKLAGFGTNEAGRPVLHLNDLETGNSRLALYMADEGPFLGLYNPDGGQRAALNIIEDGSPMLHMWDAAGTRRLLMGFASNGTIPVINVIDASGAATAILEPGTLVLRDGSGQARVLLSGGDAPAVKILAADGQPRWQAPGN